MDDKVAADQRGHGFGLSLEVYSISVLQAPTDSDFAGGNSALMAAQERSNDLIGVIGVTA